MCNIVILHITKITGLDLLHLKQKIMINIKNGIYTDEIISYLDKLYQVENNSSNIYDHVISTIKPLLDKDIQKSLIEDLESQEYLECIDISDDEFLFEIQKIFFYNKGTLMKTFQTKDISIKEFKLIHGFDEESKIKNAKSNMKCLESEIQEIESKLSNLEDKIDSNKNIIGTDLEKVILSIVLYKMTLCNSKSYLQDVKYYSKK